MAPLLTTGAGLFPAIAAGGSYTGPGDVVSSALFYVGSRGYTAAYSTGSNPAFDLVDQAGANPITVNILSTGDLDIASINTWVTAHTVTTIFVVKAYDQTGNGRHLVQASLVVSLTLNAVTNRACMTFANSHTSLVNATALSQAEPFTISAVAKRTSRFTTQQYLIGDVAGNLAAGFGSAANTVSMYAQTDVPAAANDSAFHGIQYVFNNATSFIYVDGAAGSTSSSGGFSWTGGIELGTDAFSNNLSGLVGESGVWSGAFSGTQQSNMNSNQHTYWGF